jgi:site-specific DNA-methyltransferase (adenine-specific)
MRGALQIAISEISIPERYRTGLGGETEAKGKQKFEELVASLKQYGQLQPVVLSDTNELIAGFRRLTGAQYLGWTQIAAVYIDELDEVTRRELEIEENLQRLDMTWKEIENARADLHKLKVARDPSWGQAQTAQVLGKAQSKVSEALLLQQMMNLFPEIKGAKTRKQALSIAKQKARVTLRKQEIADNPAIYASIRERVVCADSVKYIKTLPDESIAHIITDPPFGIDYDQRKIGTELSGTAYKDDEDKYRNILTMAPDLYRVLKPNAFFVWFLGPTWYQEVKLLFRSVGFNVDEIPIIWDRSDGKCYTNRPDKYMGRGYDMALHCHKGDPQMINRSAKNVRRHPPVPMADKEYIVERPIELYLGLLKDMTLPGELVADFFGGSGKIGAACAQLGRPYLVVEEKPEQIPEIITMIYNHTPQETEAA